MPFWFNVQHAEEAKAESEKVEAATTELVGHLSAQASARAEERRQMLNRINRKCRAHRGPIWNAKRRDAYARDPELRQQIRDRNRESRDRHKDEQNAKRRERYASDAEHRQKRLQENRESALRRQSPMSVSEAPGVAATQ